MGAVKRNPEGLLLLAAGAALLMRKMGESGNSGRQGDFSRSTRGSGPGNIETNDGNGRGIAETVANAARTAGEYASDVGEGLSDKASSYASAVSEYADDTARAAHSAASHVVEEQPLAVVLLGLAAGAAVAAAFPTTQLEKRAFGPTGARFRDAAGRAGEQLKSAGIKAGESLMNAAEERGLNTEGLKEAARDAGDAFNSALSNEQSHPGGQGASRNGEGSRRRASASGDQVRKDTGTPAGQAPRRGPR